MAVEHKILEWILEFALHSQHDHLTDGTINVLGGQDAIKQESLLRRLNARALELMLGTNPDDKHTDGSKALANLRAVIPASLHGNQNYRRFDLALRVMTVRQCSTESATEAAVKKLFPMTPFLPELTSEEAQNEAELKKILLKDSKTAGKSPVVARYTWDKNWREDFTTYMRSVNTLLFGQSFLEQVSVDMERSRYEPFPVPFEGYPKFIPAEALMNSYPGLRDSFQEIVNGELPAVKEFLKERQGGFKTRETRGDASPAPRTRGNKSSVRSPNAGSPSFKAPASPSSGRGSRVLQNSNTQSPSSGKSKEVSELRQASKRLKEQGHDPLHDTLYTAERVAKENTRNTPKKRKMVEADGETVTWSAQSGERRPRLETPRVGDVPKLFTTPTPQRQPARLLPKDRSNRRNNPWTDEEVDLLVKGVHKYGEGKWAAILCKYPQLADRTSVNLKDKWRNLSKCNR